MGGLADSAGVAGAVAVADVGTSVEDATGTGEEEAGGVTTVIGAWAKAMGVKRLRKLRIKNTCFISNDALIGLPVPGSASELRIFELAG